jgi:hypothetical protein
MRRVVLALLAVCLSASPIAAHIGPPVDIPTRAKGAEQVIVATVVDVETAMDVSVNGDQLIVSHALLQVEETMKGGPAASVQLMVEGGTFGGLTLRVSDMPTIEVGERAVFFVDRTPAATRQLHRRGLGMLKLDTQNRVPGTSLSLDDIREMVRGASQ